MITKKILLISVMGILALFAIFFLFFDTYTISGKITDLASKEAVKDAKVSVGRSIAMTDKEGFFQLMNIRKYQSVVMEIKVPDGYEEMTPISVKSDIQNIAISPTVETMTERIINARRNGQYDYLWDFMHPDDQIYWESKENYSITFKKLKDIRYKFGFSQSTFKVGKNTRKLDSWTQEITGKNYTDVMEVPVETIVNENNSQIELCYFQKIDGVWKYYTASKKEDIQQIIEKSDLIIKNPNN
jgi:hypothetical protein